ncbi:hypothetical protein TWF569_006420 [Orbilia oligospora]|uniref:Uncharacterized protein n=1 Tax=Orbilia oligospora TaxID=2813651 RepID=A0A7C8PNV6_ORBOL|nr:hypothetical protein TWF706_010219 [Orbilia oligospora]KAF3144547.1 hypothetical protein TWF594_004707 [Orbilia oligospora]KAF3146412.1 hypothetical protein TWF569_006420 [Orbilia oligospora]KAF3167479.1 hypothetical protein TWF751_008179 [Orbilia oligospora]KAF3195754.1 hypothetical protein TWF225_000141 [Orbilia oligospora]
MKRNTLAAIALGLTASTVSAQSGAWQQCGGVQYTGPTTCVSGYSCKYLNDYYWQCIPSDQVGTTTTTTTRASTTPATTIKTTTTTTTTSSVRTSSSSSSSSVRTSSTTTRSTTTSTRTTTSSSATATSTGTPGIKYWFSFGDSYTQTGFDPNGVQPAIGNPLGNPPYPGWTSANGPNWIDVATVKYNRSLVLTYNLAYGGATIDANLVQPYASNVLSLTDQTNQFLTYYANKPASAPWSSSNTLFSVFIGINDIANSWWKPDWLTFIDTLLTAEFALVEKMYNSGGRQFLISNIPAIERTPMMLADTQAARDGLKAALALWSTKLQTYITNFKATHSGTTFWFYDSYADYNTVLNNPATFGMNPDVTLYGNDLTYAWSNNFHPSVIIQDYMGKRVADLLASWW